MFGPEDIFEPEILRIFLDADDAMQGVIGFQLYVGASTHSKFQDKVSKIIENKHIAPSCPPIYNFPLTNVWRRNFTPEQLVSEMDKGFEWYFTFSSLTSLISIFGAALKDFTDYLVKKRDILTQPLQLTIVKDKRTRTVNINKYWDLLQWTSDFVNQWKEQIFNGRKDEARVRIIENVPNVCCQVDEARRARNCFIHNRGLFDKSYGEGPISVPGRGPEMRPEFRENPDREIQIPMTLDKYVEYSQSHIELLHDLHDLIQRKHFHLRGSGYSYRADRKIIDWRRVFNP